MKKLITPLIIASCLAIIFSACKKEAKQASNEISASEAAQIKALGFNPEGAQKTSEGYLVEGDIMLSNEDLSTVPTSPELVIANEEHYRTNNLVNTTTYATIDVALNNTSAQHQAAFSAAVDEAIRRYNAENLRVRFRRVSSGQDITINSYYQVSNTLGSSGFPSSTGRPYGTVQM